VLPRLGELGILAAAVPAEEGGLGLAPVICAALIEELARGWASVAAIVGSHLTATHALLGGRGPRRREVLGGLGRGEMRAVTALGDGLTVHREGPQVVLAGETGLIDGAPGAAVFVVAARDGHGRRCLVAVPGDTPGIRVGPVEAVLGLRGADAARMSADGARLDAACVLPSSAPDDTLAFAHLAIGALGVGIAQAAFEAALRYAQQRTAFGKPIGQHQAIQLKLADMATAVTAARLLVSDAGADPVRATLAKLEATATATRVTLESMRTHGGYGYTAEFPIERLYRDAARLPAMPIGEDAARETAAAALRLATGSPFDGR
jgi:alkylation response protein AidB-like acyl-CoA dehydrogenase